MTDSETPKRPGRPRKGLRKVTLSLLPAQVSLLRIFALSRSGFAAEGRTDLSEAVRDLLALPPVAAILEEAQAAWTAKMRGLLDAPGGAGLPDATRLYFESQRSEDAPNIDPASAHPSLVAGILSRGLGAAKAPKIPSHGWTGQARKALEQSIRSQVEPSQRSRSRRQK